MDTWKYNILILVLIGLIGVSQVGAILKWRNESSAEDSLTIKFIKNEEEEIDNDGYANLTRSLRKYSLDEKCQQGLDFGVGFQWYNPYVDMGMSSSDDYSISGIFPHVTKKMMAHCCPKSKVTYGRHFISIKEIEENAQEKGDIDLYFPLYAQNGKDSKEYKDFPFITIATAPRIVVLVPDRLFTEINPRVNVIVTTIFNTWPMLIFILISTSLAGLTVWFLDHKMNAAEFPPTFYQGAWEGIWWAFVTMTTVGYGDRSPRSIYARVFCLIWILVGIVLISFFTGLVTTALSASATPVFNVAGSRIGAITGSLEFKVGVGYNAEMKAFHHHPSMFHSLQKDRDMRAVMIDNFILSANSETLTKKMKVRMEREYEIPISYGMALGDQNSTSTFKCFQRYVSHNSHEVFEIISKKLIPVNNPTDQTRLEVAQSESLFSEDTLLKKLIYVELGVLLVMVIAGILSEKCKKDGLFYHKLRKNKSPDELHLKADVCSLSDIKSDSISNGIISNNELQSLLNEYDEYHLKWIHRVRSASKPPPPIISKKESSTCEEM